MTLDDYLHSRRQTNADFAAMIGVDHSTVSRLRKDQLPSKAVMDAIYRVTEGAVTANDFFGHGQAGEAA